MQLFLVTFRLSESQVRRSMGRESGKCPLSGNGACSEPDSFLHTAAYRLPDGSTTFGVKEWLENEGHTVDRVEIAALY